MPTPDLGPVTDAHRRAAFARLALRGLSFEAAMAIDGHRRVIEAYAHQLRTREWQAQHRQATRCVRRLDPATGRWCTQRVPGEWEADQAAIPITTTDQP